MAADLAAPVRDVDTRTPFDPDCGALDGRRLPYEPIEPLECRLERDDGRADWAVREIPKIVTNLYSRELKLCLGYINLIALITCIA